MTRRAKVVYQIPPDDPFGKDEVGCLVEVDEHDNQLEILGWDGGEPEDQILCRDWSWVAFLADRMLTAEDKLIELGYERK